jgi:hypothetical protein
VRWNGKESTEDVKEEPKSMELERGEADRPEFGVYGSYVDAYDEVLVLEEGYPKAWPPALRLSGWSKSSRKLHMPIPLKPMEFESGGVDRPEVGVYSS